MMARELSKLLKAHKSLDNSLVTPIDREEMGPPPLELSTWNKKRENLAQHLLLNKKGFEFGFG